MGTPQGEKCAIRNQGVISEDSSVLLNVFIYHFTLYGLLASGIRKDKRQVIKVKLIKLNNGWNNMISKERQSLVSGGQLSCELLTFETKL